MYKKILFKTMLLLCALVAGSGSVWADDVSFIFTGSNANCNAVNGEVSGISYVTGKTGSASATAYNTTNGLVLYGVSSGGGYFNTTTAINGSITNIEVTTNNKKNSPKYTVYGSEDGNNWIQIGEQTDGGSTENFATSAGYTYVKIANTTAATAQLGVNSIVITYTPSGGTSQLTAPTLTATASNGAVTLEWSAIANASGYTIQYADNDQFTNATTIPNATSPKEISGLTNGTTYYFKAMTVGDGTNYLSSDYGTAVSATPANVSKITITQDDLTDFTNTYAWYDWSAGGVSGQAYAYKNSGMQFNSSKDAYCIYNSTPIPGTITSVKMVKASGTDRSWTLKAGTSEISTTTDGTQIGDAQTVGTSGATWTVDGAYNYFLLYVSGGSTVISSIEITYIPSTDPIIVASDPAELAYNATGGEFDYSITNPTSATLNAVSNAAWITNVDVDGTNSKVTFSTSTNTGAQRTGTITLSYTGATDKVITITQAAYEAPVATTTYSLATAVVPGRHYIITSSKADGKVKAMGSQNTNNRAAVEINVANEVTSVTANDAVVEFLIEVDNDGFFTIYDEAYDNNTGGYLYAAGTGSANNLKTRSDNENGRSQWKITFGTSDNAIIKANTTDTERINMRYNNSSTIFSCYGTGQNDIYLFEKDGDNGSQDFTASINAACTDGSKYYGTFSAPFAFTVPSDVTVSEIAVANETLSVSNYSEGAVIPANTGVMISSTTAGDKTFTSAVGGTSVRGDENRLRPTLWGITDTEMGDADANCKYYRLTMHNGTQIGFWYGADGGAAFDVVANKAYLAVPENLAKMGFTFGADGEATAIETINNNQYSNNRCYNLNGQQVSGNYKGIVIVNGKKVMNK